MSQLIGQPTSRRILARISPSVPTRRIARHSTIVPDARAVTRISIFIVDEHQRITPATFVLTGTFIPKRSGDFAYDLYSPGDRSGLFAPGASGVVAQHSGS
jgi:hypothetical protein